MLCRRCTPTLTRAAQIRSVAGGGCTVVRIRKLRVRDLIASDLTGTSGNGRCDPDVA